MRSGWWRRLPFRFLAVPSSLGSQRWARIWRTMENTPKLIPSASCSFWDSLRRFWSSLLPCFTTGDHNLKTSSSLKKSGSSMVSCVCVIGGITLTFCLHSESALWSIMWLLWTRSPGSQDLIRRRCTCRPKRYLQLIFYLSHSCFYFYCPDYSSVSVYGQRQSISRVMYGAS